MFSGSHSSAEHRRRYSSGPAARLKVGDGQREHVAHVDDFFDNQVIIRVKSGQFVDNNFVEISVAFDYLEKLKKAVEHKNKLIDFDRSR